LKESETFYNGIQSWNVAYGLDFEQKEKPEDFEEEIDGIFNSLRLIRLYMHFATHHNFITLYNYSKSEALILDRIKK
jgi:hypothetical protein